VTEIRAWAAAGPGAPLRPFRYDPGRLGPDDLEIAVEHCGICHSDLSVIDNDWGRSTYPLVPGHEVVGRVVEVGEHVPGARIGQRVGIGWNAGSCMHCRSCISGSQHLCASAQATIVGHHGGFAERIRSHWIWALPLPESLDAAATGPLLCGGITVFSPLINFDVRPTHRVGVVGIGGLGHLALKFLGAWGCDVTAFTSSEAKREEALTLGAHRVVSSRDPAAIAEMARSLDFLLVTVNVTLDWRALLATLAPRGRLHVVGAVLEPIPVPAFSLIAGQKSISGSPTGSPADMLTMLDFAARHGITAQVERFPMSRVNEALEHLKAGRAHYRVVLDADFG
jgi:alcohol/geraniol dehydrogenase (NADP+)